MAHSQNSHEKAIEVFQHVARSGRRGCTLASLHCRKRQAEYEQRQQVKKRTGKYHKSWAQTAKGRKVQHRAKRVMDVKVKMLCLLAYGGNPPACACCGISDPRFLTIDHVEGGGTQHRIEIKSRNGTGFYYYLRRAGFPKNPPLQVLCWNCNCGRYHNGGVCPHKSPLPLLMADYLK